MANDEQTSTCSSYSYAREQQTQENVNNERAPSCTEAQELWSPPPFVPEEPFGVLDDWAKLLGSNVQPTPPTSEFQEIQQEFRKLEQSFQELQQ